jgi:ribonuclease-3
MDPTEYHQRLIEQLSLGNMDPNLLRQAFCHSSYAREHGWDPSKSNQRLEFLGDAVLDVVLAEHLFLEYPHLPEGQLTKMKAAAVRSQTLSRVARKLDLGAGLLIGKGETETGGREKPSLLADGLEALIGAVYISGGMEAARKVILRVFADILAEDHIGASSFDHKTALQETMQQEARLTPRYAVKAVYGPPHARIFTVEVFCGERTIGRGAGPSKQAAQQEAAREALLRQSEWLPAAAAETEEQAGQ